MDRDHDDAHDAELELERVIEREIERWLGPPPSDDHEEELINGSARSLDGRFVERDERWSYVAGLNQIPPERIIGEARIVPKLFDKALSGNPNEALQAVRHLRYRVELLEAEAVARARGMGWAWQDIGNSLRLSRQTVHRRYAKDLRPSRPQRKRPNRWSDK